MAIRWSVVITTRNRAEMLRRAIRSCMDQTVPCEIVVVDEASNDHTSEVTKNTPNLKYIKNPHATGHSAAANRGIKEASANWVKPLDDDDWLAPNCIETMTNALASAHAKGFNPVLISGRAVNVDVDEREIGKSRLISHAPAVLKSRRLLELMMLDQAPIGTPVQVGHNREAALRVGGWNEHRTVSHQHGDEIEFWIRLAAKGDAVFIPDVIAFRTVWAGGSQERIPPKERYHSNVSVKDMIAAQLGTKTPQGIKSYLALHWALVASKNGQYGQAFSLGMKWLKSPKSIGYMLNRRRSENVQRHLEHLSG
jgi:glycosyltransferase involved in cell wall biosynthesis